MPVLGLSRFEKDRVLGTIRTRPVVTVPPLPNPPLPLGDFTVGKSQPGTDTTEQNAEAGLWCTRWNRAGQGWEGLRAVRT